MDQLYWNLMTNVYNMRHRIRRFGTEPCQLSSHTTFGCTPVQKL